MFSHPSSSCLRENETSTSWKCMLLVPPKCGGKLSQAGTGTCRVLPSRFYFTTALLIVRPSPPKCWRRGFQVNCLSKTETFFHKFVNTLLQTELSPFEHRCLLVFLKPLEYKKFIEEICSLNIHIHRKRKLLFELD